MGHHPTDAQLDAIYEKFLALADKKKEVAIEDLEILVQDEMFKVPEKYILVHHQILSGTEATPMAALKVRMGKEVIEEAATGNGPFDAATKCIERIVGRKFQLIDFGVNAITSGQDAVGEARVRIRSNGTIYSGGASSTNIIEASIKAYLAAINRWAAEETKRKAGKKGAKVAELAPMQSP
jgi:2-isopropylmalate synthase